MAGKGGWFERSLEMTLKDDAKHGPNPAGQDNRKMEIVWAQKNTKER